MIVLGFSFAGDIIEPGEGPIAILTYSASDEMGAAELLLSNITLSDTNGQEVPIININGMIEIIEAEILGCMDSDALN